MSKKNLTQKSGKSQKGMQLFFIIALVVILIYIFYPNQRMDVVEEDSPKPEIYVVVSNGCGISNVAEEVSSQLLDMRLNVQSWGNTDNPNCVHQETQIVIRQVLDGQQARLAYLQKVTGIKKVITAQKDDSLCEFELLLGKDYINYFKK